MTDKNRNEKLLRVIQEQSNIFHELEEEATKISSGQIAMQDCTARQLFRYAVALLHGMGVQRNIRESLSLFRVLIGNDTLFQTRLIYPLSMNFRRAFLNSAGT